MTQGLERILRSTFSGIYSCHRPEVPVLDEQKNYTAFLIVDLKDRTTIDCPLCMVDTVLNQLNAHRDDNLTEIVIPLQRISRWRENELCKSIDSALKQVFESRNGYVLNKAIIGDIIFYGLPGLLLNYEYQPLMMVTVEINLGENIHFGDYKVTIPPHVYFGRDKLSQGIVKKLMPYYLETTTITNFNTNLPEKNIEPVVIFKPIDNYVTWYNCDLGDSNVNPNQILKDNIETLKYSLTHVF